MNAHAQRKQTLPNDTPAPVLQIDANQSLRTLVQISRKLLDFADQEAQALITNDLLRFGYLQKDKNALAMRYAQASEEFRGRLNEFRTSDRGLLLQLDNLQEELKSKTQNNNMMIESIKTRASANTQSTLFTVQEMGQRIKTNKEA